MVEAGFKYSAEEQVSLLFLEDFHRRYNTLLDAIGTYISRYSLLTSPFQTSETKKLKEQLLITIKANFTPVLFMLEAINSAVGNSDVKKLIDDLKELHNKIVASDEIELQDLITINEKISKIIAMLLLTPIVRPIASKLSRLKGAVEVEEE